jgi:hypothetical protein
LVAGLEFGHRIADFHEDLTIRREFLMPVLPGGRYPDLIDDDANLPEISFVPPDEAPLDVRDSPSAGGWATSYPLPPEARQELFTGSVHRPDANRQRCCSLRSDDTNGTS